MVTKRSIPGERRAQTCCAWTSTFDDARRRTPERKHRKAEQTSLVDLGEFSPPSCRSSGGRLNQCLSDSLFGLSGNSPILHACVALPDSCPTSPSGFLGTGDAGLFGHFLARRCAPHAAEERGGFANLRWPLLHAPTIRQLPKSCPSFYFVRH